jgi:hypothetical protein
MHEHTRTQGWPLTSPGASPMDSTPRTRPWNAGREGLRLFTRHDGSPLAVPTKDPAPSSACTVNVTRFEAVGTTLPAASTTSTCTSDTHATTRPTA